jgi:hypothetical protein
VPRKDYTGVSIKDELADDVEKFIADHPTLGYRSITQFIEAAVRQELDELRLKYPILPRFEHINVDSNGAKILDRQLKEVIQVYIRQDGIYCEHDETDECEHIKYALELEDVQKIVIQKRKEGWNLPLFIDYP